jgi:hypothetical protein
MDCPVTRLMESSRREETMVGFRQEPIPYGVKLIFDDGTVVNWYRDSRRKTVYA